MSSPATPFVYIDAATVSDLITWPLVVQAVDQALRSVVEVNENATVPDNLPNSVQKARTATVVPDGSGLLFTMPGYIGNYTPLVAPDNTTKTPPPRTSTLGCKLVTSFNANPKRDPPLPAIAATIVLFDIATGTLSAILEGTQITTWRTVAASLVATRTLYFERHHHGTAAAAAATPARVAIVGCGVEGRAHAIGMASTFRLGAISLWNRTVSRAQQLHVDLERMRDAKQFADDAAGDSPLSIRTAETVADCVRDADIIVVATYASEPLIRADMLRAANGAAVHINAIGAGPGNHHSELADDVYRQAHIYVDSMATARVELATLGHPIRGHVGDVVAGVRPQPPAETITVFQSMGMAVEDCAVGQAILDRYKQQKAGNGGQQRSE